VFIFFILIASQSYASLTITPLRVVFEERDRSAEVVLINTSEKTNTYRVSWMHNKQKLDGYYDEINTPLNPDYNPEDMIIFSDVQLNYLKENIERIFVFRNSHQKHLLLQKIKTPQA
jgi:hypothetical protein